MTAPNKIDETEELDFEAIPLDEPKNQGFAENIDRRTARYVRRVGEAVLGLPGDIYQLVRGMSQKFGGITPEEDLNFVQKGARKLADALPGSEELRAMGAEQFPNLEPRDESEEFEDEVVQDFATLALPVKGKIPFARAIGTSLIGNIGKEWAKELGIGEGGQAVTKMGLMLFAGMFGKGRGVQNHI